MEIIVATINEYNDHDIFRDSFNSSISTIWLSSDHYTDKSVASVHNGIVYTPIPE